MQDKADLAIGYTATGLGATGAAWQMWGDAGNLVLIGLNVLVAIGGLYLLYLRIHKTKGEIADNKRARDERNNLPPAPEEWRKRMGDGEW